MQKPIEYYLSLPAELVDMNDPDIPETIKIRARNELQRQKMENDCKKPHKK